MNRQILTLMTAAMVLMVAFVSCKKDRTGGDDNGGGGGGGGSNNPSIINAKVVGGDDYNGKIATVKALLEGVDDDYVAASGKYENGGFWLSLPRTIPAQCLISISYFFDYEDFEGTISDWEAKIGGAWIAAYDSQEKEIGEFWCENEEGEVWALYLYVDRQLIIKGHHSYSSEEFDFSFTKGWNIVYGVETEFDKYLHTTKKPSGINLNWYYDGYCDWKKKSTQMTQMRHFDFAQCKIFADNCGSQK